MIEADVGGGFGVRGEFYPEDFLIPFAARKLNRAVKWIEDRRENLIASNHARDAECELEIACERDGTIRGLRGSGAADLGAYIRTNGVTAARNTAQVLTGPYRVPNIRFRDGAAAHQQDAVRHLSRAGALRGRFLPRAAVRHGGERSRHRPRRIPPPQSRRRARDAVVVAERAAARSGHARPTPATTSRRWTAACKDFGWTEKQKLQGKLIDGRRHGIAVGCYLEGGGSGPRENVRMVLEGDGTVSLYTGSSSVGQGVETVMAQIAADALDMPMARINRVQHGSTDLREAGLRLVFVALDRDGRLGHRAGGGLSQGRDPRRGGKAPAMRAERNRRSTATTRSGRTARRSRCPRSPPTASRPKAPIPATSAPIQLWRARRPCRGRSRHRPRRAARLHGGRGRRPHHQSADPARPDRRRHRAGARRRAAGASRLRLGRPVPRPARWPTTCCRPRATSR